MNIKWTVLAFVAVTWRTTSSFVIRDIYGCRSSLRDNEGVVHYDGLRSAEILRSMDMAFHLLESLTCGERFLTSASIFDRQCAAFDDVESISWVIMPCEHLTGVDSKCSHCHRGRAVEEL